MTDGGGLIVGVLLQIRQHSFFGLSESNAGLMVISEKGARGPSPVNFCISGSQRVSGSGRHSFARQRKTPPPATGASALLSRPAALPPRPTTILKGSPENTSFPRRLVATGTPDSSHSIRPITNAPNNSPGLLFGKDGRLSHPMGSFPL